MRTWRIILVVALATLAIGLVTISAFGSAVRPAAIQYGTNNGVTNPYGGYAGGMMGVGMMGNGYAPFNGYSQQYAPSANGYGRCMDAQGWP
jgi:ABC-type multidrug transport system permease subunit